MRLAQRSPAPEGSPPAAQERPCAASAPAATAGESIRGEPLSTAPQGRADTVAGFLCAFSLALSGIALVRQPALLAPAAIVVALLAARMTVTYRRLAAVAVWVAALSFLVGMSIAVWADVSLF